MQGICPACLTEQYLLNVVAFSAGDIPCGSCNKKTTVMTLNEYRAALCEARRVAEAS